VAENGETRRHLLFRRFRAPFDEWEAQGGSTEHDELTSGEIRAEDGPRTVRGLGWRWLGLMLTVTVLLSTTAAPRGRDGCGWAWHLAYIARRRSKTRKGEIGTRI
jgi:hypothetical protein